MTKKILFAAILIMAVLSIGWSQQSRPSWEYKFDYKCNEKRTNELAAQGWELAGFSESSNGVIASQTCAFRRAR